MTYTALRKTYGLPEWKVLSEYFDVGKLEESENVLQAIIKQIMEKLDGYIKFFEELLQPENLHSMHEAEKLTEKHKTNISKIYKTLMYYYRACCEVSVMNKFEEQAALINDLCKEWPAQRKELLIIVTFVKKSWNTSEEIKYQSEGYFG